MIRRTTRTDEDFAAEIEAHLALEADQLVGEGIDPAEAEAAARRAFGNRMRSEERFYYLNRRVWLDNLARSARYALRQMRLSPVSTATIVLSLGIGIGLATAIFSLADQALVRALPVRAPAELVQLEWRGQFIGSGMGSVGYGSLVPFPLFRELRAENEVFQDLFARTTAEVHVAIGDDTEPVQAEIVTGSFFATLGIRPALGRLLTEDDDLQPDAHPMVVLSHDYWQRRFGGRDDILGRSIRVNDHAMTVIGVAEPGFFGMDWSLAPAIWLPMMMKTVATPGWSGLDERRARFAHVYARLAPGTSSAQAAVALEPWFKSYLRADTEREGWPPLTEHQLAAYLASDLALMPGDHGQSRLAPQLERPMLILLAATGLILLLACLNVANLSLARVLMARRATALRTALGASRWRIACEQAMESGLLAACGCLAGALLAPALGRGILSLLPQTTAGGLALRPELDLRVLAFAVAVTALTTILAGTAPALYAASIRPLSALKLQAAGALGGLGIRKLLVVGQFALALVLLIGAGLFARTLGTLRSDGPGYATTNLLMFRLAPRNDGYETEATKPLMQRVLDELEALPEVAQAGIGAWPMLEGGGWNNPLTIEATGRVVTDRSIPMNAVSAGFFQTLGIPIVRGRDFGARDAWDEPGWNLRSAIVNEELVERYLGGMEPIGARLDFGTGPDADPSIEIVGVVRSFRDYTLRKPEPQVFFSLWERSVPQATFYIRGRSATETLARSLRDAVQRVDPALTVLSLRSVDDQLDRMLAGERMLAALATIFAALATVLAMIGLYGVLSFSAELRAREIGLRLALGAPRWSAGGLMVREAGRLTAAGLLIALPVSWVLGRLVESQLYGVGSMDAMIVAGAAAALAAVGLLAAALPARRVAALDPLEVLRGE